MTASGDRTKMSSKLCELSQRMCVSGSASPWSIVVNLAWIFLAGMIVLGAGAVYGQDFPNKPIRIIVGGTGGGNDTVARLIAQGITASLGQRVVVENRATALISGQVVSQAPPDGYALL